MDSCPYTKNQLHSSTLSKLIPYILSVPGLWWPITAIVENKKNNK